MNPWIPYEVHASPHDVPGYDEPLFPVADTEIGRIGCAICYDWLFPEALRQLAMNGAEVLVRVSAYMDPWGATEPMDWWTIVNRCRALENVAYVVAANQGAAAAPLPAVLVAGRQHGRGLRRADPRPGLARAPASGSWWRPVDVDARCATSARRGAATTCSRTCARRRTRSTAGTSTRRAGAAGPLSYEENNARIDAAKKSLA